jgi:phospholipid/cholesterol/gamma-HCH transport system substrate-binding protein
VDKRVFFGAGARRAGDELMEPEAKYTVVGTAVIVLLALVVAAAVWLKSTEGQRDDVPYKIYFARQSLEGLQIRSEVKMQGIRVGSVTGFRISPRRPGTVEVLIRVDGTTPVRTGTLANVDRHLLTGIASIHLVNPDENGPRLTEAPPNEPYPVIAEGESEYKLTESAAYMAQRADETMQRINRLLSDENQVALSAILVNLQHISASLDRTMTGLDRTLTGVDRAADELRKMSSEIAGDARKLTARYDALGAESTTAVKEVSTAIRQIGADVARLSTRTDALLADGNVELRLTAQELRTTAESLGAAARRFSEPNRILFGSPKGSMGPGEAAK